ncbi:MAG: hypothetical protein M3Y66_01030, partial [Actinomycetota bacterium]|nr:hypothetical protein [Actinomycetota bacterium]
EEARAALGQELEQHQSDRHRGRRDGSRKPGAAGAIDGAEPGPARGEAGVVPEGGFVLKRVSDFSDVSDLPEGPAGQPVPASTYGPAVVRTPDPDAATVSWATFSGATASEPATEPDHATSERASAAEPVAEPDDVPWEPDDAPCEQEADSEPDSEREPEDAPATPYLGKRAAARVAEERPEDALEPSPARHGAHRLPVS